MKLMLLAFLTVITTAAFAHEKTDTVKVYGKCEMCKARIEKAALAVDGVKKADWNVDTKILTVTYNGDKTSLDDIQKKIAAVGHDTEKIAAEDAVYKKLPGCCRYDRNKASTKTQVKSNDGHSGHNHK